VLAVICYISVVNRGNKRTELYHYYYHHHGYHRQHIVRTDTIKDLAGFLVSKLYFYQHVDYVSSQALKMGLTRTTALSNYKQSSDVIFYFSWI
jgi:hypothetical protein